MLPSNKIRLLKKAKGISNYNSNHVFSEDTKCCHIDIPGIGRVLTGEQHINFHSCPKQPKQAKLPVAVK
jgi:hypothetical protein